MTTDELVKFSFAALKPGKLEIRPGQSNQLALMRRLAPNFINKQLWKGSKKLVPVGMGQNVGLEPTTTRLIRLSIQPAVQSA